MSGFEGRILHVNLSNGEIRVEERDELFYRRYFGGRALIARYLLDLVPVGADPLGEDNVLVFSAGVLTGAPVAGSGRGGVGALSPLTGGFGNAEGGGFFPAELKGAGYDALVITGAARTPKYLYVTPDAVEIRDAAHLWGKKTAEADALLRQETGKGVRIASIGPGGENLVRYAAVAHDLTHFAGRTGLGAVMGSKKLKAVVVRGQGSPEVADREALVALSRWLRENQAELVGGLKELGTAGVLLKLHEAGGLPTHNFRAGSFEGAEGISGERLRDEYLVGRDNCYACPINCKRVVALDEPYPVDPVYGGPEYETLAALGSLCGVDDLAAVCKGNELCNAYTLDTISTGVCLAFAMEAFERGLLTAQETGGLRLTFGNAEAMLEGIEAIAHRRGPLGELLADGVRAAATRLGPEAEALAMHVRGLEMPMHEPRYKWGLGLGYMVSPTGADHCHNIHDTAYAKRGAALRAVNSLGIYEPLPPDDLSPAKVRLYAVVSRWRHFLDSAVLCYFVPWRPSQVAEMVRAVTGWDVDLLELMRVGERGHVLARMLNLREGLVPAQERLPARFLEPLRGGRAPSAADLEAARQLYYELMNWDQDGRPRRGRLVELEVLSGD